jgi:hypothetical protein
MRSTTAAAALALLLLATSASAGRQLRSACNSIDDCAAAIVTTCGGITFNIPAIEMGTIAQHTTGTDHAGTYVLFGAAAITVNGISDISGDVGITPGTAVTWAEPREITGVVNTPLVSGPTAIALQTAKNDLFTAFKNPMTAACVKAYKDAYDYDVASNNGAGYNNEGYTGGDNEGYTVTTPTPYLFSGDLSLIELPGQEPGTLVPGLYMTPVGSMHITSGDLTLKGDGVYIFSMFAAFSIDTGKKVFLTDGATADKIFWQVGSSATIHEDIYLPGTMMAFASVTAGRGANFHGRVLALNGAVTINTALLVSPTDTWPGTPLYSSGWPMPPLV